MAKFNNGKWTFSDDEVRGLIDQARRGVNGGTDHEPEASRVVFNKRSGLIHIHFPDGFVLGFPVSYIKELRDATPEQIAEGELTPLGDAIHWNSLDAHYTIGGLLAGRFGTKAWMKELGKVGGSRTSEAKAEAARKNGSKGGRPRLQIRTKSKHISHRRTHEREEQKNLAVAFRGSAEPVENSESGSTKKHVALGKKTSSPRRASSRSHRKSATGKASAVTKSTSAKRSASAVPSKNSVSRKPLSKPSTVK
jgi:hypothetical protein